MPAAIDVFWALARLALVASVPLFMIWWRSFRIGRDEYAVTKRVWRHGAARYGVATDGRFLDVLLFRPILRKSWFRTIERFPTKSRRASLCSRVYETGHGASLMFSFDVDFEIFEPGTYLSEMRRHDPRPGFESRLRSTDLVESLADAAACRRMIGMRSKYAGSDSFPESLTTVLRTACEKKMKKIGVRVTGVSVGDISVVKKLGRATDLTKKMKQAVQMHAELVRTLTGKGIESTPRIVFDVAHVLRIL